MADFDTDDRSGETQYRHFAPSKSSAAASDAGAAPAQRGFQHSGDAPANGAGTHRVQPVAPAGSAGSADEPLRRVKKKKHTTLKYVGIGCGSLVALVLVFAAIIAVWFGMLNSSMGIKDDTEREELSEELAPVENQSDAFYTLILGSDAREGDAGSRSDVIMLARIDPGTGTVSLVSIPRDTMVTINGETQKINAAYAFGGAAAAVRCVSEFAGVPISHYVRVHFEELEEVVDMLGGVWVDIPESFSTGGYTFTQGEQLLSGAEALAFVRDRYHVSGGDFGRAQAQRIVVEAIIRQVLKSSPVELPGVVTQLANCVTTDLSLTDLIGLAQEFMGQSLTVYSAICPSYTLNRDGISYVGTMFDEWRRVMQLTDAGLDPNSETAEVPEAQAANEELGAAPNSAAPRDYQDLAANAMTTDDVTEVQ